MDDYEKMKDHYRDLDYVACRVLPNHLFTLYDQHFHERKTLSTIAQETGNSIFLLARRVEKIKGKLDEESNPEALRIGVTCSKGRESYFLTDPTAEAVLFAHRHRGRYAA